MSDWSPLPGFWRDRPVLVTGGAGFLGSHLTGMLLGLGAAVVVIERDDVPFTPVSTAWRGQVAEVDGDVRDQELLERVLGEYQVRTVFHLAAQTQVEVANETRCRRSSRTSGARGQRSRLAVGRLWWNRWSL